MAKNDVRLGDGIGSAFAEGANDWVIMLIGDFFRFLKGKTSNLPEKLEKLLNDPDAEQSLINEWSDQLFEEGIISKAEKGMPDTLLVSNFHQDGYLSGLHIGYVLAMMSLADNGASKDLILSVRDALRPNLFGLSYNNSGDIIERYHDEKYRWIESEELDKEE